MGVLVSLLISLGTALVMNIAMEADAKITYERARNGLPVKESDVRKALQDIRSKVSKQGSAMVDKYQRKLDEFISLNPAASSALRKYRIQARQKVSNRLSKAKSQYDDDMNKLSNVEETLSSYSYTPDSYKTSKAGQDELKDISDQISKIDTSKYEQPVTGGNNEKENNQK